MKRYKLAILFTQPPFGSATSREGLDALLAASAFCEEDEIAIGFLFDGVFNLVKNQQPAQILQKDHIATFKLIELYDLSECFVSRPCLEARQISDEDLILTEIHAVPTDTIFTLLQSAEKVMTF